MGIGDVVAIRKRRTLAERYSDLSLHAKRVAEFIDQTTETEFLENSSKVDAVMRCLSIVGDLVDSFDEKEHQLCYDVDFAPFVGLGDHLIQQYDSVDERDVWLISRDKLPALKICVDRVLFEHFSAI